LAWPWVMLDWLRVLGGGVCHQLPGHSLQVAGIPLPLCARCTGTYLGSLLGLTTVIARRRLRASLVPPWPVLALFAIFFLAWGGDGLNSYLTLFPGFPHLYEPSNGLRLLTGTLQGLALSLTLWPVAGFTLWQVPERQQVISFRETVVVVAIALAIVGALLLPLPAALLAGAMLSILGLLSMFTLLNTLLLSVLRHQEGKLQATRDLLPALGLAFALGTTELLVLDLLRRAAFGA